MCSWADINCQKVSLTPSLAHCAGHTTQDYGLGRDANGNDTKTRTLEGQKEGDESNCYKSQSSTSYLIKIFLLDFV